jgi:surface carbohydrate biosynthesis protein (TIGR04326 family)
VPNFKEQFKFLFKPHPACFIDPSLHSPWIALLRYESIEDIATKAYMGIATSSTSASVDAYFMGIPIAIYRNQLDLNSGPLRGSDAVPTFDNAQELIKILNMKPRLNEMSESVNSFFFLDDKLPRWKKLISKYAYS